MARITLGVSGGIGAYKAVEVVRGLQTGRPRRHRGDDPQRPALRRRAHLRGDHPPAGGQQPVGAGAQRRHRAHRAGDVVGPAAGGPGDRQRHRQVRARHRRRLPDVAVPGHDRAGAAGAGDEHAHARAPGGRRPTWRRWRRAACSSSSRARATWPAAGSGRAAWPSPRTSSRRCNGGSAAPRSPDGRCWSRPGRPSRTSIRCASSATGRAAAWAMRWRTRRRAAAPRSCSSPDRRISIRRPASTSCGCAAPPRCTAR